MTTTPAVASQAVADIDARCSMRCSRTAPRCSRDLAARLGESFDVLQWLSVLSGGFTAGAVSTVCDLEPGDYAAIRFVPVGSLQGDEGATPDTRAPDTTSADPADPAFPAAVTMEC